MDNEIADRLDAVCREAHQEALAALRLALEYGGSTQHARRASLEAESAEISRRCAADTSSERSPEDHLADALDSLDGARFAHRAAILSLLPND